MIRRPVKPITRPARPPRRVAPQLAEQFDAVGLADRAEHIRDTYRRVAAVSTDTSEVALDHVAAREAAVLTIINGTSTPVKAALDLDVTTRHVGPLATELAALAKTRMITDLARTMWLEGDQVVAELDDVVQDAVAVIVEAAPLVRAINNDTDAIKSSTKASAAWSMAVAAAQRVTVAQGLANTLRTYGFVPDLRDADAIDWWFHQPENAVLDLDPNLHPVHRLLAHIEAGARPGCCTADHVVELGFLQ